MKVIVRTKPVLLEAEQRAKALLFGGGAQIKQKAWDLAVAGVRS